MITIEEFNLVGKATSDVETWLDDKASTLGKPPSSLKLVSVYVYKDTVYAVFGK